MIIFILGQQQQQQQPTRFIKRVLPLNVAEGKPPGLFFYYIKKMICIYFDEKVNKFENEILIYLLKFSIINLYIHTKEISMSSSLINEES